MGGLSQQPSFSYFLDSSDMELFSLRRHFFMGLLLRILLRTISGSSRARMSLGAGELQRRTEKFGADFLAVHGVYIA
jgi:hypothetical protein